MTKRSRRELRDRQRDAVHARARAFSEQRSRRRGARSWRARLAAQALSKKRGISSSHLTFRGGGVATRLGNGVNFRRGQSARLALVAGGGGAGGGRCHRRHRRPMYFVVGGCPAAVFLGGAARERRVAPRRASSRNSSAAVARRHPGGRRRRLPERRARCRAFRAGCVGIGHVTEAPRAATSSAVVSGPSLLDGRRGGGAASLVVRDELRALVAATYEKV